MVGALSNSFLCHTLAPQDQCVEVTEESKALLEEYNKTVSFLLSWAWRSAVQSPIFLLHP